MADDNQLENEVLEFEDDALPELPDDNPFEEESKKPWLLIGIGIVAVTLVMVVILKLATGGKSETGLIEIPIGSAEIAEIQGDDFVEGAGRLAAGDDRPVGMPERVVEQRRDVKFDPDKPVVARPTARPAPRPAAGATAPARAAASVTPPARQTAPAAGTWSVQFGAYNTRAAAEAGQRRLESAHRTLFSGHNFAILSAVMPNGATMYRLRVVGFANSAAANNFCRSAKNDGIQDCYAVR